MGVDPPPYPKYREQWAQPTTEYRVVIWEQPKMEDVDPERIGWGERTHDLVGVRDVREALEWAERKLMDNTGPYSHAGGRVRDREYVLYAKVPGEDRFVQIAGWNPTIAPEWPDDNLSRRRPLGS